MIANIFNGVNGGLSAGTVIFAGRLVYNTWADTNRVAYYFFASIVVEALVTSGVVHSVAHRLFGSTLNGNAYVGKISFGLVCYAKVSFLYNDRLFQLIS